MNSIVKYYPVTLNCAGTKGFASSSLRVEIFCTWIAHETVNEIAGLLSSIAKMSEVTKEPVRHCTHSRCCKQSGSHRNCANKNFNMNIQDL